MLIVIAIINLIVLWIVVINALKWPGLVREAEFDVPVVSLLIPARNEAHHIESAIKSALAQGSLIKEILVYDDHSDDSTASIVEAMQAQSPKIVLFQPSPLPDGWLGKPFACWQLAANASGEWLLFLDADTRLHPGAVSKMLGEATSRNVTFLSSWPGILAVSFWERTFMPMLNFVVFSLFPTPLQSHYASPSFGLAHGACLFMRHEEYKQMGGHERVKQEFFEDTVLAREWRKSGLKGICLNGRHHVSVRMYSSLREIIEGFSKIVYPAFRHEATFWIFMGFHLVCLMLPTVILPFAWWFSFHPVTVSIAAGAVLLARAIQCIQFGYPLWSVLLHPLAECGLIGLGLYARHKCRHSKGVQWKGRTYNPFGAA
jgi:chlorobactene glucosyltransferase